MIEQIYNIDMVPSGAPVVVHVSQYDTTARRLVFHLYNGGVAYVPASGTTATIRGTKPDGTGFMYSLEVTGNTVAMALNQQMAAIAGDVPTEITVAEPDGTASSANFVIRVEPAALDDETVISETDIPVFEELTQQAQTAATTAQAAQSATEALFPSTGTTGQYLQKTANGTQWADVDELPAGGSIGQVLTKTGTADGAAGWVTLGGASLAVTITYADNTYSANHTFAEIEENIAAGGTPYAMYGTTIYYLSAHSDGQSVTFTRALRGSYGNFTITPTGITYSATYDYTKITVTINPTDWESKTYTVNDSAITDGADIIMKYSTLAQSEISAQANISAYKNADLWLYHQTNGSISIYANGTVPTSIITVYLLVFRRS